MTTSPQYEWQASRVLLIDRVNRQRYQAAGFLLVRIIPGSLPTERLIRPTGLGYHSQYRDRELPPMYRSNETRFGFDGSYYPLHVKSGEQLMPSVWGSEETIRWFLQRLVEELPWPDYWLQEEYPAILDRFPGGRSAIALLEHCSVWQQIARTCSAEDPQMIQVIKAQCQATAEDAQLDASVRRVFDDLAWRIDTGSTVQAFLLNLEKWTMNLERAASGQMPPFCTTMSQKGGIYRRILALLRGEESQTGNVGAREVPAFFQAKDILRERAHPRQWYLLTQIEGMGAYGEEGWLERVKRDGRQGMGGYRSFLDPKRYEHVPYADLLAKSRGPLRQQVRGQILIPHIPEDPADKPSTL